MANHRDGLTYERITQVRDLLAEGTLAAALKIGKGAEQYAIQVKGLELPAYDPRGVKAHGLNLMTCAIGADHNSGYAPQEVFGAPVPKEYDRFTPEEKGALTKRNQDITAYLETGILCSFMPSMDMLDEAQRQIGESEIAYELMGFNAAMAAANIATSNEEEVALFAEFSKYVQGPCFMIIIAGNSEIDFDYKTKMLAKIVAETGGQAIPKLLDDPKVAGGCLWR